MYTLDAFQIAETKKKILICRTELSLYIAWLMIDLELPIEMGDCMDEYSIKRDVRAERDKKIVEARDSGLSYAAIGLMFQLSSSNVKNRIDRYHRKQQVLESDDPFVKLAPKTFKLLQTHGLSTIDAVVEAYRRNQLLNIREFGRKRLREIEKWFPVPDLATDF